MSHDETTPEPAEQKQPSSEPNLEPGTGSDGAGLNSNAFEQPTLDRIIESLDDD